MELEIGTDLLHKDVWLETLERFVLVRQSLILRSRIAFVRLKNHRLPSTMIAVCGATGAGKSSMLNAILDGGQFKLLALVVYIKMLCSDNIVPTSGMNG